MPVALMPQFAQTADKQALWTGFLRRNPPTLPPPFDEPVELRRFSDPALSALAFPEGAIGRRNPDRGARECRNCKCQPWSRAAEPRTKDRTYPFRGDSGKV
jgi:hypothetical protein